MRLLWQSFLHEPFHEHLFLFVAGENGIHERDAVVLGVTERFATSRYYCLMPVYARSGLTLTVNRTSSLL